MAALVTVFGDGGGGAGGTGTGGGGAGNTDRDCLALAMYWEARSEGVPGMEAVGWVVLNRLASGDYPGTACEVVRQGGVQPPCQFSFWCDGRRDTPDERQSWAVALDTAERLLTDPPADPTGGATLFHRTDVRPAWAQRLERTGRIGRHLYYRDGHDQAAGDPRAAAARRLARAGPP